MGILTWTALDEEARLATLQQWSIEGTPVRGIAILLEANLEEIYIFAERHSPDLCATLKASEVSLDTIETKKKSFAEDLYPPFTGERRPNRRHNRPPR